MDIDLKELERKDKEIINLMYKQMCKEYGIKKVTLKVITKKYCGRDGSCTWEGLRIGGKIFKKTVLSLIVNIRGNVGSDYILCHEVAHQIAIAEHQDSTHGGKFQTILKRVRKAYEGKHIAKQLSW